MQIECPHCQNLIDLLLDKSAEPITCPTCGSSIELFDPGKTATSRSQEIKALGRFQVIEHLGSGQFGDVWLAEDSTLNRQVALKIPRKENLDSDDVERILREARAAAQLHHPNIVRVYEIGKEAETIFIVSEVIHGTNLRDWLADISLKPESSARLCATLADALHHAHEAGIVHRDLKPGNVLMDRQGNPHLTDFGLAKRESGEITITFDGRILGTPAYMSPEQARGQAHSADRRSDVYSLGVMLFEMLTGVRPFRGNSKMMLIQQVLTADPPFLRKLKKGIPRDLETICLKAISKEPARRYQTAFEMADDLRRFLDGKPIVARPVSRLERGWRWSRRNPIVTIGVTAIVVFLVLVTAHFWREWHFAATLEPLRNRERELSAVLAPLLHTVKIASEPPGANVVFIPLHSSSGEPQPKLAVPMRTDSVQLAPGNYMVVASTDARHFHEVYRRVPNDIDDIPHAWAHGFWKKVGQGAIELRPVAVFDQSTEGGMCKFGGSEDFVVGSATLPDVPLHHRRVPPYLLDPREVSVGEWKEWLKKNHYGLHPKLEELAVPDDHAVSYVSWDRAVAYAESIGKRLPDEIEYEFASTLGGQRQAPWGNDLQRIVEWSYGPIGKPDFDRLETIPPVVGLYSNVAEWTSSLLTQYPTPQFPRMTAAGPFTDQRIVRGAPLSVIEGSPNVAEFQNGPRERNGILRQLQKRGLGFRCARSVRPRLDQDDFVSPLN